MKDAKQNVGPKHGRFSVVKLEQRIAPAQAASPPGQFPAGNPAQTEGAGNQPGNSFKGGK